MHGLGHVSLLRWSTISWLLTGVFTVYLDWRVKIPWTRLKIPGELLMKTSDWFFIIRRGSFLAKSKMANWSIMMFQIGMRLFHWLIFSWLLVQVWDRAPSTPRSDCLWCVDPYYRLCSWDYDEDCHGRYQLHHFQRYQSCRLVASTFKIRFESSYCTVQCYSFLRWLGSFSTIFHYQSIIWWISQIWCPQSWSSLETSNANEILQ